MLENLKYKLYFTNVSVEFTLELMEEYILEYVITFYIRFDLIKILISKIMNHELVKVDGKFFKQIKGLRMGSHCSAYFLVSLLRCYEIKIITKISL